MASLGLTSLSSLSNFIVIQKCFFSVTVCSLNIVFFKISFMKITVTGLPGMLFLRYITKSLAFELNQTNLRKKERKREVGQENFEIVTFVSTFQHHLAESISYS